MLAKLDPGQTVPVTLTTPQGGTRTVMVTLGQLAGSEPSATLVVTGLAERGGGRGDGGVRLWGGCAAGAESADDCGDLFGGDRVKLAALWLIARRLPRYTTRDGMVLGAAVGFGFAAFESAGYAFNALFTRSGLSLWNLLETEVLRGILTPVGHGLWTAILSGVLFATAARYGRPRLTGAVLGWYVLVAVLHALIGLVILHGRWRQALNAHAQRAPEERY